MKFRNSTKVKSINHKLPHADWSASGGRRWSALHSKKKLQVEFNNVVLSYLYCVELIYS